MIEVEKAHAEKEVQKEISELPAEETTETKSE